MSCEIYDSYETFSDVFPSIGALDEFVESIDAVNRWHFLCASYEKGKFTIIYRPHGATEHEDRELVIRAVEAGGGLHFALVSKKS